jgi:hypothetical protein
MMNVIKQSFNNKKNGKFLLYMTMVKDRDLWIMCSALKNDSSILQTLFNLLKICNK